MKINKNEIVHTVLKYEYYDAIDGDNKVIEYRDDTPFWRKRLDTKKYIVFHRAYTNVTMMFKIKCVEYNWGIIEIYLGERINV